MATIRVAVDAARAKTGAREAREAIGSVGREAREQSRPVRQYGQELDETGESGKRLKQVLGQLFAGFTAATVIVGGFRGLVSFEQGLVGVGKTTDILGDELKELGDDFVALSRTLPEPVNDLLALGQVAGQLGVRGSENIIAFTDTVSKLGTATDLAGAEGATALARILNLTGEAASEVGTLGAVIVDLGNNVAATEREIALRAQTIAQSTASFDLSSTQVTALGAAYAELGFRAELASSATGRAFRAIDAAIREGGADARLLSELIGEPIEEITRIFREDALEGFQLFLRGVAQVSVAGGDVAETLQRLGLEGEENLKVIPTLAQGYFRLGELIESANRQAEEKTALDIEAGRATETLGGALGLLGNTFRAVRQELSATNGVLQSSVLFFDDVVESVFGLESTGEEAALSAQVLAVAIQSLAAAGATFVALKLGSSLLAFAQSLATTTSLISALAVVSNPVFVAAAAVGLLTAGGIALTRVLGGMSDEVGPLTVQFDEMANAVSRVDEANAKLQRSLELGDRAGQVEATLINLRALENEAERLISIANKAPDELISLTALQGSVPDLPVDEIRRRYADQLSQAILDARADIDAIVQNQEIDPRAFGFTTEGLRQELEELARQFAEVQDVQPRFVPELFADFVARAVEGASVPVQEAREAVEEEIKRLQDVLDSLGGARAQFDPVGSEAIDQARDAVSGLIRELQFERTVLRESERDQRAVAAIRELTRDMTTEQRFAILPLLPLLIQEARLTYDLARAKDEQSAAEERLEESRASVEGILDALRQENALIGLNADQRAEVEALGLVEEAFRDILSAKRELAGDADLSVVSSSEQDELDRYLETVRELFRQRALLRQQQEADVGGGVEIGNEFDRDARRTQRAADRLSQSLADLRFENEILGQSFEEQQLSRQTREFEELARAAGFSDDAIADLSQTVREALELQRLAGATRQLGEAVADLSFENSILGQTFAEQQISRRVREFEELARSAGFAEDAVAEFGQGVRQNLEFQQRVDAIKGAFGDLGASIGGAFGEAIREGEGLEGLLENLEQALFDFFIRQLVVRQLANAISGGLASFAPGIASFFGAQGATVPLGHTNNTSFNAVGSVGLIDRPTSFPIGPGSQAVFGEGGSELPIFPVTRDRRGRLAIGGAEGAGGQTVVINQTVNAPDPRGMRLSAYQQAQDLGRLLSAETRGRI